MLYDKIDVIANNYHFILSAQNPPFICYQSQLSSAQFGLVLCPEGNLLGSARSGKVGQRINDTLEAGQCELGGSGEPSVHPERSGEGQNLQIGTPGEGRVHLGSEAAHIDGAVDGHQRGAVVETLPKGGRCRCYDKMSTKCLLRRGGGVDMSEYANRILRQFEP